MIAVDTNILIYAHRGEMPEHPEALSAIRELAEGPDTWAIAWHTIREFLAVVTNPRIFLVPTPVREALAQASYWLESPTLVLLREGPGYFSELSEVLTSSEMMGPAVHDANVAALCRLHSVTELWSADRDFSRFPGLRVRNPLTEQR